MTAATRPVRRSSQAADPVGRRVNVERAAVMALGHRAEPAALDRLLEWCRTDTAAAAAGLVDEPVAEARFHRALLDAAGDPALRRLGDRLLGADDLGGCATLRATLATLAEHEAIVVALQRGALEEAASLLEAHLYRRAVLALLSRSESPRCPAPGCPPP
ncbi:FCD domain-containing protein [Aciditerrimonas ferrireducens]|uniref:FCD domain-containing protein n=1 Tax=Aciditerrimonas ferrireducens TaxID=667306 RepID=A0ABV6C4V7_9ACTN